MTVQAHVRIERDSLGEVAVPADVYWGAQTQRSLENFPFGPTEQMPLAIVRALALIKRVAAQVNRGHGLAPQLAGVIEAAAAEVVDGKWDDQFPLAIWQTGSGTQTNMNVNEVIAGRANEMLTGQRGGSAPVHPNDHVNLGQSSNDCFPTAMHLAVALATRRALLPALDELRAAVADRATDWGALVKIGRTHLQDAAPLTLGQEFSGYLHQLDRCRGRITSAFDGELLLLAQGGTAVGTGLNAPPEFGRNVIAGLSQVTGLAFVPAPNSFEALASHDPMLHFSASLAALAVALTKIANDLRLLSSGPDAGLGELRLPANEPGSSIMPGKVNPTQVEMLTMVAAQVLGNHQAVTLGDLQGQLELNAFKPLIAAAVLRSVDLLAIGMTSFARRCVVGIEPDVQRIGQLLASSPMVATALVPVIGYAQAAELVGLARNRGISLQQAAAELNLAKDIDLDRLLSPQQLVGS